MTINVDALYFPRKLLSERKLKHRRLCGAGPVQRKGVAFEDFGRKGERVFSRPRSWDLGAHSQGVPRGRKEPVLGQDLQADIRAPLNAVPEFFLFWWGGGGRGSWGNPVEATGVQKICRDLKTPESVSFPRCPVGLNCRDGALTSSSSHGDHQRESMRWGGWGMYAGRIPKKAENSRHRPCRIDLCFSLSPFLFNEQLSTS